MATATETEWLRRQKKKDWQPLIPPGWSAALLSPFLLLMAFALVVPIGRLVAISFENGTAGYASMFHDEVRMRALVTTLWMSAIVAAIALIIGYLLAWTLRQSKSLTVRLICWAALLMPMWMSIVVKNYAWTIMLGRNGVLNAASSWLGLDRHDYLFTPTAVVTGMVYTLYPYAALPLYVAMSAITDGHVRAAESLGASRAVLHRTVVLPLVSASLLVTGVLVYVLSMGFYVVPLILGGPNATFVSNVVSNDIFLRFDTQSAASTSVVLLVIISVGMRIVGRDKFKESLR